MFIGHFAVAFGAKRAAPTTSLGTLILAAQFVDLLWPLFLLVGLEHVRIDPGNTPVTPLDFYDYPISHSLIAALIWSVVLGGMLFFLKHSRRNALVVGLLVFSHWILDYVTHRPDLPLGFSGGPYYGLGLWNSKIATVIVESTLFVLGLVLYLRTTRANDRVGIYAFWGLVVFMGTIHITNFFGPPPPSVQAIAIAGNAGWLFVIWGYWVDKHRTTGEG